MLTAKRPQTEKKKAERKQGSAFPGLLHRRGNWGVIQGKELTSQIRDG